jgi:FecR protein
LNKLNYIINKTKEIKNFKVFDVDDEWDKFKLSIDDETSSTDDLSKNKSQNIDKETGKQVIYLLSFAAGLILIFAFMFLFSTTKKITDSLTTNSAMETIKLVDGSVVQLHPNSKLDFFVSLDHAQERRLELEGDAEFDIAASILPLRVYHDSVLVEVLGTEFSIKKVNKTVEIKNISGSVKVSEINKVENFRILQSGDTFIFTNGRFINPADTLNTAKSTINTPLKKPKKNSLAEEVTPGSIYLLESVIKNHIIKYNKKKVKLEKKIRLDDNARVKLDLTKSYRMILEDLKKQGYIDFKKGDCEDCIIITSPNKN